MGEQQEINLSLSQTLAALKVKFRQHDEDIRLMKAVIRQCDKSLTQIKFLLIVLVVAVIANGDGVVSSFLQGVLSKLV
jgi:hypothetical protein